MIAFAKTNLGKYDTSNVCRVLNVSRSGYYKAMRSEKREEAEIKKRVVLCFEKHKGLWPNPQGLAEGRDRRQRIPDQRNHAKERAHSQRRTHGKALRPKARKGAGHQRESDELLDVLTILARLCA